VLSFNQSRLDKVVDQIRHDGAVGAEVRGERELAERLAIDCCGQHLVAAMAARESPIIAATEASVAGSVTMPHRHGDVTTLDERAAVVRRSLEFAASKSAGPNSHRPRRFLATRRRRWLPDTRKPVL
jgi:hypothetical protein